MNNITKAPEREIIKDFAKIIAEKRERGPKPEMHVIPFRNDEERRKERAVWQVPIGLLRYRKDNGRICSDVFSFEQNNFPLDEANEEDQEKIRKFLEDKDKEKTEELKKSIMHSGQRDPAVITCDGFLINGNRRKMVLESLIEKDLQKFGYMKVVILPNEGEEGGPPDIKEIEELENRYQLQSHGKAEYYGFDKALSIRKKMGIGISLEEQLRDNPLYVNLTDKEIEKAVKKYENDFLNPLKCVDRYLASINRERCYDLISTGMGDRQGRWQAFIDYSQNVYQKLQDPKKRIDMGIEEDEQGDVEDICFKIVRMREFKDGLKVHKAMRDLPKWLKNKDSRKELMDLLDVDSDVPQNETRKIEKDDDFDKKVEDVWKRINGKTVVQKVMNAKNLHERKKEKETPLTLLQGALKKLQHEAMDIKSIRLGDLEKADKLTKDIQKQTSDLESEIYHCEKDARSLTGKKNKIDY